MGLMKILARRPGKTTNTTTTYEPRPYEFEPPAGSSLQTGQDGFSQNMEAFAPSRFLKPQLSLNSLASKGSLEPPPRFELGTLEPSLFRHRNLSSLRRPSTAASSDSMYYDQLRGPQRPKREPRRPPVSFRKPSSSTASLSASYQASSIDDRSSEIESFVGMQRGRSDSITSVGSGRFKDLLDAQEEIRPIDFRTRIEATGARDYGEDVADRNMRQNAAGEYDSFSHSFSVPQLHETLRRNVPSRFGWLETPAYGSRAQSVTPSSRQPQYGSALSTHSRLDSPNADTASLKESDNKRNTLKPPKANRRSFHTYTPSGFTSFNIPGFTTIREGFKTPVWPNRSLENNSRPYCASPTGSNFSVPKSPKPSVAPRAAPEGPRPTFANNDVDVAEEDKIGDIATPTDFGRQTSPGTTRTNMPLAKAATTSRLSDQTYRYSFASSMTSRHTSGDYTALDHRRVLNHDANSFVDSDGDFSQEKSLPSIPQDDSLGQISTFSSGLRPGPSVSKQSSYIEDRNCYLNPSDVHDWEPSAYSNAGSASTVSNPSYSGSSGRPQSRHTKATSVTSEHLPLSSRRSEESCRSTTFGQPEESVSPTWSPTMPDFNIYDYISSDDESFTTEKKPRKPDAEGEEDLLFKAGYGTTGAALPGLLEGADYEPCPSPIIKDSRTRQSSSTFSEDYDDEKDPDAAEPADIEDDRISVDRDLPKTFLRHTKTFLEQEKGTLGRGRRRSTGRAVVNRTMPTAAVNSEANRMSEDDEYYTPPASAGGIYMYDEEPTLRRGLQRLSAFGTWHGRNFTATDFMDDDNDLDNSADTSAVLLLSNKEDLKKEATTHEKVDVSAAVRLRKAAKAQKRAEEAKNNRQKRMTRTFGNLEQEIAALLRMQNQDDDDEGCHNDNNEMDADHQMTTTTTNTGEIGVVSVVSH